MGLDISAFKQLTKIDCVFDAEGEPIHPETREALDYDFRAHVNPDFPGRNGSTENLAIYRAGDSFGFRAGGYGGYNAWRNELAKLAAYPAKPFDRYKTGDVQQRHDQGAWEADSGPFWELINFSDCEGVIGAEVAAKLAKDFADHQEKADAHTDLRFLESYNEWRKAFEMAADNGAVDFH